MRRRDVLAGALTLAASRAFAQGDAFPGQSMRMIIPFPPGAANDTLGRLVAEQLGPRLGRTIIVENRGGAGGSIGSSAAARATPDGNTLLLGHIGTLAVNPAIYPKLPYDPVKDFAAVSMIAAATSVVVVNPQRPYKTIKEMVEFARANPNQMRYCTAGNGSAGHLVMLAFLEATGLKMEHVPYKGLGPGLTDLVGGVVDVTIGSASAVMQLALNGQLRALAVTSPTRMAAYPDLPTIAETAAPGFDVRPWYGIAVPAATPPAVVARLNKEINAIITSDAMRTKLDQQGVEPMPMTPQEFGAFIKSEVALWGKLIKAAGVTAE